ncbi:cytochrome P450 [Microdochium trichocladiopsis]|uniref:Cytochrome P450 n=1 Tax=Microdochium trichocladiopsis TaxID=1682393 RepID=A0A9P8Y5S8_9PEZI|nr:cytochrome P450 [Microdochium trichocladiopsis]KAH7028160.1 cytochrome P450 [Microdochium trichocladiopsis]
MVPSAAARPAHLIVPRSQTSWLLGLPDHVLGATEAQNTLLHSKYSFPVSPALGYEFPLRVVHRHLNRALHNLTPDIWEEVQAAMDTALGCDTENWKSLNVWAISLDILTRVTNRIILGPGINRDPTLLKHMVHFVDSIIMNCFVLDFLPKCLHPIFGPLVSIPNRMHFKRGAEITIPLIKQRLHDLARKEASDPAYEKWKEPEDFITWDIKMAKAENNKAELEPENIAKRILPIEFAAIHTTTITCMYMIIDLMSTDPSLGVVEDLRREAAQVFAEEGGQWTKEGLFRLHHMDSAIRESQRFSTFALTLTERMVVAPEGITNEIEGWHAPQGTVIKLNLFSVHKDPEIYENPDAYDPFRYSRTRESLLAETNGMAGVVQLKKTGLTTTSDTHLAFSHGRHACPGRFFVGQELKMIFANLLLNYDIKPITERPKTEWLGSVALPPMKATIEVRRRKAAWTPDSAN